MLPDCNCFQVLAPPANLLAGKRICHVSRDVALILSLFMENSHASLSESNEFGVGFEFKCLFVEDSSHREEGFRIEIVVFTTNSELWTDHFTEILAENKINFFKLPTIKCKI